MGNCCKNEYLINENKIELIEEKEKILKIEVQKSLKENKELEIRENTDKKKNEIRENNEKKANENKENNEKKQNEKESHVDSEKNTGNTGIISKNVLVSENVNLDTTSIKKKNKQTEKIKNTLKNNL